MGTIYMINDTAACTLAQGPQKRHRMTIQTKYLLYPTAALHWGTALGGFLLEEEMDIL